MQDANYNVVALVNTSGTVVERFEYDPYGNVTVLNASGSATKDAYSWVYMYQGGRMDSVTGLYKFQRRDYSPELSRWMEQDPIGVAGSGANLYQFLGGDPLALLDPSGTITVRTLSKQDNTCGGFAVWWNFILDKRTSQAGYIVQEVNYSWDLTSPDNPPDSGSMEYWEVWYVAAGQQWEVGNSTFHFTDEASEPSHPDYTGTIRQEGDSKFFYVSTTGVLPVSGPPPLAGAGGFGGDQQVDMSMWLPSTKTQPAWWNQPSANGESLGTRLVTDIFDCCCGKHFSQLFVQP